MARSAVVWFHRARAVGWAVIGAVSFPLGWADSVVLVWIASVYANTVSDWGAAEAADNREVLDELAAIRQSQKALHQQLAELHALFNRNDDGGDTGNEH